MDKNIAKTFVNELEINVANFRNTNNLLAFRTTYHSLHEKFHPFLLRNGIGFNFIIKISATVFVFQTPLDPSFQKDTKLICLHKKLL